jgi:hypothetical protein
MLKKFMSDSKEKKQARNLRKLVDFKRKKSKIVFKFSIAIMKLNFFGVYLNLVEFARVPGT